MKKIFCPRCSSPNLQDLGNGYYKCLNCGYEGSLGIEKGIIKR